MNLAEALKIQKKTKKRSVWVKCPTCEEIRCIYDSIKCYPCEKQSILERLK